MKQRLQAQLRSFPRPAPEPGAVWAEGSWWYPLPSQLLGRKAGMSEARMEAPPKSAHLHYSNAVPPKRPEPSN